MEEAQSSETGRLPLPVGIGSPADLDKLPTRKLIDMYNAVPGVKAVTKFTSKAIGVARTWKALTGESAPQIAVAAKPPTEKAMKAKKKSGATAIRKTGGGKKADTDVPRKKDEVMRLLGRKSGVKKSELMEAMGWLDHTVRGFISTLQRDDKKIKIESFKTAAGKRVYRLEDMWTKIWEYLTIPEPLRKRSTNRHLWEHLGRPGPHSMYSFAKARPDRHDDLLPGTLAGCAARPSLHTTP